MIDGTNISWVLGLYNHLIYRFVKIVNTSHSKLKLKKVNNTPICRID